MALGSGDISPAVVFGALLVLTVWIVQKVFSKRDQLPLPPGPKGLPLVGNLLDLPPSGKLEWQHWLKHKDLYGPISSVNTLGTTIVLIHDKDIAVELLEKRAAKYSGRPHMMFAVELCDYSKLLSFVGYNQYFRDLRKLMAGQLGAKSSMTKLHSAIEFQVRHFLLRTMKHSEQLTENLQGLTGSLLLETLYGYTPSPKVHDPLITMVNKFMYEFGIAAMPGAWLVDIIPWLRYLPDWAPGANFKKIGRQYKKTLQDVARVPVEFTEKQIEAGVASPSFVQGLLENNPSSRERDTIKWAANALYDGGADTTVAALSWFFLAMTLFPEVQQKAREEIDRITGGTRLPSFEDRETLPYVEAVVKETLRWRPIAPLGLPHATDEDDECQGYFIPKGSVVVPAIAWFAKDPGTYHEPEQFKPERFLGPSPEPLSVDYVFGFGRRICPGKHLADANLFLVIAQSLATLDIRKAVDGDSGEVIEPLVEAAPGLIMHPKPYTTSIAPRSEKFAELIKRVEVEHPWKEGDEKMLQGLI